MTDDSRAQRRHRRVSIQAPVRISTLDPETDPHTGRPFFRAIQETCANLSTGGAFIRTNDPLPPGRRVLVEIQVEGRSPIEAVGRVAWSKTVLGGDAPPQDAGVGVEFLGGSREALSALERMLVDEGGPET